MKSDDLFEIMSDIELESESEWIESEEDTEDEVTSDDDDISFDGHSTSDDEEERRFENTFTESHYVLEAGWKGLMPVMARSWVAFPGQILYAPNLSIPLEQNADIIAEILNSELKLFGLLIHKPNNNCAKPLLSSGFGVLCKVLKASYGSKSFSPDAHVMRRFRIVNNDHSNLNNALELPSKMTYLNIEVLPEVQPMHPLRKTRLAALDSLRQPRASPSQQDIVVRRMDAALTPWPHFVFEIIEYKRICNIIQLYLKKLRHKRCGRRLPSDPISLSFWAAGKLMMKKREAHEIFIVDDAFLRLQMICSFMEKEILYRNRMTLCWKLTNYSC